MESSGRTVFKTVPGFACRATFEGDIEGFTPLKVLLATTLKQSKIPFPLIWHTIPCSDNGLTSDEFTKNSSILFLTTIPLTTITISP